MRQGRDPLLVFAASCPSLPPKFEVQKLAHRAVMAGQTMDGARVGHIQFGYLKTRWVRTQSALTVM